MGLPLNIELPVLDWDRKWITGLGYTHSATVSDGKRGVAVSIDEVIIKPGLKKPYVVVSEGEPYQYGILGRRQETPIIIKMYISDDQP